MNVLSLLTCESNGKNQVTLQWTPPTGVLVITHYELAGLPQYATCSPGPCDMINGTTTTITGLQCNTSSMVSVRAVSVNCTTFSDPIEIFFHPTTCSACGTYIKNVTTAKLMPSKYIVLMFMQILPRCTIYNH